MGLKQRVLVTGASGFVARALLCAKTANSDLVAASRRTPGIDGVEVIHGLRGWSEVPKVQWHDPLPIKAAAE